jgi:hypothetical protein
MTKLEKWIYFCKFEYGCCICRRNGIHSYAEYHHRLSGGKRIGPFDGFGLCPTHHQSPSKAIVGRDHNLKRFEAAYGSELLMQEETQEAYGRLLHDRTA